MIRSGQARPPLRPVKLGPPDVVVERHSDGAILMRSPHPLPPYPRMLTERLAHWAKAAPDRIFLAQRDASGGWRTMSYAQTLAAVRALAAALLQRGLSAQRPVAILSGNDIEHALLGLAAMHVGIPYAPISVPYSLLSQDFGKLKAIVEILSPGLVFAANGAAFARAIAVARAARRRGRGRGQSVRRAVGHTRLLRCCKRRLRPRSTQAHARVEPDWPSRKFCSPPDRPGGRRASKIPIACSAPIRR